MHPLPLLLLLAVARVEGRQEMGLNQQEKRLLEEKGQLLNQKRMEQANCSQLLDTFSESASNFTRCFGLSKILSDFAPLLARCANQYAKPIFMCRNCLDDYLTVVEVYDALEHRFGDQSLQNCRFIQL